MNPQDHIDKIVNTVLKSRKMDAPKIEALAKMIEALAKVKVRIEEDNQVANQPEADMDNALGLNVPADLKDLENIEIDGKKHNVRIISN